MSCDVLAWPDAPTKTLTLHCQRCGVEQKTTYKTVAEANREMGHAVSAFCTTHSFCKVPT